MRLDGKKVGEIASWVLVVCAVISTFLLVRLEFFQEPTTSRSAEAVFVDGWEEALSVGIRSGVADAPVQVVEFADFQCPYCARYESTIRSVLERYPNQIALTWVHYPLDYHPFAEPAARAADCARRQGSFNPMRSVLLKEQKAFGLVSWTDFAKQARVPDIERFDTCVNDSAPFPLLEQSKKLGRKFGVRGTPTILINGWISPVPPSSEMFETIVANVVEGRPPIADLDFRVAIVPR